jgi:hypothetical protein
VICPLENFSKKTVNKNVPLKDGQVPEIWDNVNVVGLALYMGRGSGCDEFR